jgi:hypothetical protein
MTGRMLSLIGIVVVVASVTLLAQTPPSGRAQTRERPSAKPDLYGVWDFATLTPLQRPNGIKGPTFTEAESQTFLAQLIPSEEERGRPDGKGDLRLGNYPPAFMDQGESFVGGNRSSLIIDPPEGRIPYTPEAQRRMAAARAAGARTDNPEDFGNGPRCIIGFNAGPPMTPGGYNNNVQIIPGRDRVVIMTEMVHTARIVRLDSRSHLPTALRLWSGDSVGWWEGDTLVVETTNFNDKAMFQGSSENMRLIEKFRLADAKTLVYEFTVNDPTTFTRPWTAQFPMRRSDTSIYEYACHEGNYALANMLRGARAADKKSSVRP